MTKPPPAGNSHDHWKPVQYNKFAAERRQPFDELVDLCSPIPGGTIYDLGCGPGTLTSEIGQRLKATHVIGQDNSPAMLEAASKVTSPELAPSDPSTIPAPRSTQVVDDEPYTTPELSFEYGELENFTTTEQPDLIFSNAALHWVDDHSQVLKQWKSQLGPRGQIAVQLPCNHTHPAYELAVKVAANHHDWFVGSPPAPPSSSALLPEEYAQILYDLGAIDQHLSLRVFTHELDSIADVTEWIKGAALTVYEKSMNNPDNWLRFLAEYNDRLIETCANGNDSNQPYLFTFKRILMWAKFN